MSVYFITARETRAVKIGNSLDPHARLGGIGRCAVSVYVDGERNSFGRMVMCHMWADTLAELHEMAAAIGMDREWFQPLSFPHYDVSLSRRKLAVEKGAIEVDRRTGCEIRKRIRAAGWSEADLAEIRAAIPAYDRAREKRRRLDSTPSQALGR